MLSEGDAAPDFILPGTDGEEVREYMLADYTREGPVVLAFYLFDFHPHCTEQLCSMQDLGWFDVRPGTNVLAVSTDSAFAHQAFATEYDLPFVLLSDDDGAVCERYGVLSEGLAGHRVVARRSVFVVDTETTGRDAWGADEPDDQPDWDAVEAALDGL